MSGGGNTLILAVVTIVPTTMAAILSWRSSVRANRATEAATASAARKVDAEVFEKTQGLYERAVQAAQREIDRLQEQQEKVVIQFDVVREQWFAERETSTLLRGQVQVLQMQVASMSEMITTLRHQIEVLSGQASPPELA